MKYLAPPPGFQQAPSPAFSSVRYPQDPDRSTKSVDLLSSRGNTVNAAVVLRGTLGWPQPPRERRAEGRGELWWEGLPLIHYVSRRLRGSPVGIGAGGGGDERQQSPQDI